MGEKKQITLYSDGACSINPGRGGYGAILKYKNHEKVITGSFLFTTNNRMELLGVIEPLEALRESCRVEVFSDSQYVVHAFNKGWLKSWIKNSWKKTNRKPVLNIDLWKRFMPLLEKHDLHFNWVRGHNDHPENERCDQIAVKACFNSSSLEDKGYKPPKKKKPKDLFS